MLTACVPSVKEEREQSLQRWTQVRNSVLFQLAEDAFDSGAYDNAKAKLLQVLEIDPDNAGARLMLARVHLETGRPDEAQAALDPFNADPHAPAESYYLRGLIAELTRNYDTAAVYYRRAAHRRPQNDGYAFAAVEAMLSAGDVRQAQAFLQNQATQQPLSPQWFYLLAEVARTAGNLERAAVLYQRAVDVGTQLSGDEKAWIERQLASTYRAMHDWSKAAPILQRLADDPRIADRAALQLELAWCRLRLGDIEAVEHALADTSAPTEDANQLRLALAKYHAGNGNWPAAMGVLDDVLAGAPSHADALMLKSLVALQSDDIAAAETAVARWQSAAANDPLIPQFRSALQQR